MHFLLPLMCSIFIGYFNAHLMRFPWQNLFENAEKFNGII